MRDFILRNEVKVLTKANEVVRKAKRALKGESGSGAGIVWVLGGIVLTVIIIVLAQGMIKRNAGDVEEGVMKKITDVLNLN